MKQKRIWTCFLMWIMLLCVLCACGQGSDDPTTTEATEPHDHAFDAKVVVEPTCTEPGYTVFACVCGEQHTGNQVDALGHNWSEWETVIDATEETEGKLERSCKTCGEKEEKTIEKLPAGHEHTYNITVVNPTCTECGYTMAVCECGDSRMNEIIEPLGHNFGEYVSDNNATCTEDGTKTATCSRCGEKDVITEEGTAIGHNYTTSIVGPTYESEGYDLHTCKNCGHVYKDNFVDKLPEDPEDKTTYPTEREDYPFGDLTPENITTDKWEELTLAEQEELLHIWEDYYDALGYDKWPPEIRHNWLYATLYNMYSCGYPNHVCCNEEFHYWLIEHECDICGKTDCPANFAIDPDTLYTQPDGEQCPMYEEYNDPSKWCQTCGLHKRMMGYDPTKSCSRSTKVKPCTKCGKDYEIDVCHTCDPNDIPNYDPNDYPKTIALGDNIYKPGFGPNSVVAQPQIKMCGIDVGANADKKKRSYVHE